MKHHHVGPLDYACDGCIKEADAERKQRERRKTVWGVVLLIALVIGSMVALSRYLNNA